MASTDETTSGDSGPQEQISGEELKRWPKDNKEALERLHGDYRRRATSARWIGLKYLTLTFGLLGLAVAAVIFAPSLARQDVAIEPPKEFRMKVLEVTDKLAALKTELKALNFVHFTDVAAAGGVGVAVGSDGNTLRGTNKLKNWRPTRSDTTRDFNAVAFRHDGNVAIAVGDRGIITVRSRGRGSWRAVAPVTKKRLNDVVFGRGKLQETAVAVGDDGAIVQSRDNGRTWKIRAKKLINYDLNSAIFLGTSGTVIAVGDRGAILVSNDGGRIWKVHDPGNNKGHDLHAVASGVEGIVVAVGERGSSRISTNYGKAWRYHLLQHTRDDFLAIAISKDQKWGVAVGENGLISTSRGDLTKWVKRKKNFTEDFTTVAISQIGNTAIAAGSEGTIIVSSDRGVNWNYADKKTLNDIMALTIKGNAAMFVGENSTVLRGEISKNEKWQNMEIVVISSEVKVGVRKKELRSEMERYQGVLAKAEVFERKMAEESDKTKEELSEFFLFQTNALRLGVLVAMMFLSQHLIVLARYNFRLAESYHSRCAALMAIANSISWSALSVEEFDQVMRTFSTEGLEYGRTPHSVIEMAMELSKSIVQRAR